MTNSILLIQPLNTGSNAISGRFPIWDGAVFSGVCGRAVSVDMEAQWEEFLFSMEGSVKGRGAEQGTRSASTVDEVTESVGYENYTDL